MRGQSCLLQVLTLEGVAVTAGTERPRKTKREDAGALGRHRVNRGSRGRHRGRRRVIPLALVRLLGLSLVVEARDALNLVSGSLQEKLVTRGSVVNSRTKV